MQVKWTHFETSTNWSLVLTHKDHSNFKNGIIIIKLTQLLVSSSAASAYTNALKESIKKQTEFLTVASPTSSKKVRTDDIFTSLLIQHGRKPVEDLDMERGEQLQRYGQVKGKPVEHSQEIFLSGSDRNDEMNPKSVIITGKAGIGKTVFCQNLIRDWAENKLFQPQSNRNVPDFKFAYLLTFRQLNLLEDERVTLREILNRSSVLDGHSNIDDSLFEYIVDHSEDVLIILDGFDEYAKQNFIVSDSDDRYPNNAKKKMPVAALCAKLIKGKILKDSVVMITTRPDESDEMIGKIPFDRFVEITGFSKEQVKNYIEKYFKENEVMKNAVMDHIAKNENLVSFAHIPVLCFLMCSYFEYILNESMNTDALPVSMGDIYSEVIDMFLRKHSRTKGAPPEKTLDKLSKFAAHLLRKGKYLFSDVDDMKRFSSEEVESLKASGLLHCSPPFRKSFSETTKYFCFTHLTLQEYLAARWFVKQRKIPSNSENTSRMVLQFMSGILSKQADQAFLRKLLRGISRRTSFSFVGPLIMKCLAEYHDKEFALNFVKRHYSQLFYLHSSIQFRELDCIAISFLLDIVSTLNVEEQDETNQLTFQQSHRLLGNRPNLFRRVVPCAEGTAERSQTSSHQSSRAPNRLYLFDCHITQTGLRQICKVLKNELCTVTSLDICGCLMADECVATIAESLPLTNVIQLSLQGNKITDASVVSLCQALQTPTCKVTTLHLGKNQITDAGVSSLCQVLQTAACQVTRLDLGKNQITDAGVASLCQALQTAACKVTELHLSHNQITDAGVANLCLALQTAACKVTQLDLSYNQITDAGVASLCQALQTAACQVTELHLSVNGITDAGVASLCLALQTAVCKVTELHLSHNQITDAGVASLCLALQTAACKVTELHLSHNQITDAGVASLCLALQTAACKVTELHLSHNQITDAGVANLCLALQTAACKVTQLDLSYNQITDAGVASLCQALQTAACKVTKLHLSDNQITDAGVASLCLALQTAACKVTELHLSDNQITDAGVASLCQAFRTAACKVTALILDGNQVTDAGVVTLCQTLQRAQCPVEYLNLSRNFQITSVGERSLVKLLKRHSILELSLF